MAKSKIVLTEAVVDPRDNSIECPCGGRAHFIEVRDTNLTGGRTKAWFRECSDCGARFQCTASGKPLSMPADRRTGWARTQAHAAFDRLWTPIIKDPEFQEWATKINRNKQRTMRRAITSRRNTCYAWLAVQLGLPSGAAASIGRLNASQCANVVAICEDATWAQVEAWDRARKGKKSEPGKSALQSRKSKRRESRLLGSEEEDWDDAR